jgi:hypothetical protein
MRAFFGRFQKPESSEEEQFGLEVLYTPPTEGHGGIQEQSSIEIAVE